MTDKFRHLQTFTGKCNYHGINKNECISYAEKYLTFSDNNKIRNTVNDMYEKYFNQHDTISNFDRSGNEDSNCKNVNIYSNNNKNTVTINNNNVFSFSIPNTTVSKSYLSDVIEKDHIDNEKYIYLESPSGSGKTRFSLIDLPEMYIDKNIILIMPKVDAVKQKSLQYNIHGIYEGIEVNSDRVQISTYDGLKKYISFFGIAKLEDTILVFDEAHLRITADYRKDVLRYIEPRLKEFYKIIMLSGTPIYIEKNYKHLNYFYDDKSMIPVKYVYIDKNKKIDRDLLSISYREKNKTNIIYRNDKEKSEIIKNTINRIDIEANAECFNKDTKDNELHKSIVNECEIPENITDIIMTEYGVEALDINSVNEIGSIIIPYFNQTTPASIGQLIARFRNKQPKQIILFLTLQEKYDYDFEYDFNKAIEKRFYRYEILKNQLQLMVDDDIEYETDIDNYKPSFPGFDKNLFIYDSYSFQIKIDKYAVVNDRYEKYCSLMQKINPNMLSDKLNEYGIAYAGDIEVSENDNRLKLIKELEKEVIKEQKRKSFEDRIYSYKDFQIYSTVDNCSSDSVLYNLGIINSYFDDIELSKKIIIDTKNKNSEIKKIINMINIQKNEEDNINSFIYEIFSVGDEYLSKADIYKKYLQSLKRVLKRASDNHEKDELLYNVNRFKSDNDFYNRFKYMFEYDYKSVSINNKKCKAYIIISKNPLEKYRKEEIIAA